MRWRLLVVTAPLMCERADGALGRIRTPDLLIRSQTLYPAELRAHIPSATEAVYKGVPDFAQEENAISAKKLSSIIILQARDCHFPTGFRRFDKLTGFFVKNLGPWSIIGLEE